MVNLLEAAASLQHPKSLYQFDLDHQLLGLLAVQAISATGCGLLA